MSYNFAPGTTAVLKTSQVKFDVTEIVRVLGAAGPSGVVPMETA